MEALEIAGLKHPFVAKPALVEGILITKISVGADGSVKDDNAENWRFLQEPPDKKKTGISILSFFEVQYPNFVLFTSEIPPVR